MKNTYYAVACDGGTNVNVTYRHYFRLYKKTVNGPILVDQGLSDLLSEWKRKYDATLVETNPYPHLD